MTNHSTNYKWSSFFLELGLRALIKTHHQYSIWELGQGELTVNDLSKLNQGQGILFAPEEHVRDQISQQIIDTGLWKEHEIEGEKRSYLIDREYRVEIPIQKFKAHKFHSNFSIPQKENVKKFDVDIIFKRIQDKNDDGTETSPVFIEAKRANLVTIDAVSKRITKGSLQKTDIDKDILKLKIIKDYHKQSKFKIYNKPYDKIHTYILLWGIGKIDEFDLQKSIINKLANSKYLASNNKLITYPTKWEPNCNKVKEFLWMALLEVQ